MVIGIAIRSLREKVAETLAPLVKTVTGVNTLVLCVIIL